MSHHATLPSLSDRRWLSASLAADGTETRYLPLGPPYMPGLSNATQWLAEGAELVLLPDGYPARLVDDRITVHPLHGRYVLQDLVRRYAAAPSEELRSAMHRIADAIVARAEPTHDWLLMWYEPDVASAMVRRRRHTSGLPQAYYAALLARVGTVTGEPRYLDAADRFFEPLATPVAEGGLLNDGPPGPSLAMAPMTPRDWVLNGWLSMLVAVHDYAQVRGKPAVDRLVASNIKTVEAVIEAFDAPQQHLSRYTLVGMLLVKIGLSECWAETRISRTRVWIPDEPNEVPVEVTTETGWIPRWLHVDVEATSGSAEVRPVSRTPRLVIELSRAPLPRPNELRFQIDTPRAQSLRLEAFVGSFDPLSSAMVDRAWIVIGRLDVASGTQDVTFQLPYDQIDLFSYPTHFGRRFNGQPTNTYHATHIIRLRQLAAISGNRRLAEWADRWSRYVDEWRDIQAYEGFRCWSPEGEI